MAENTNPAYIAFGANLSNPHETLLSVVERLAGMGVEVVALSSLWRSPAWPPGSDAPDYTNAVMAVRTHFGPHDLMQRLLGIEAELGRVRTVPNAPRSCDLDLIDYDGRISQDVDCTLPHPRMHERDFVLFPLREVAPDWTHPVSGKSIRELVDVSG